jgi:hypothetical protein
LAVGSTPTLATKAKSTLSLQRHEQGAFWILIRG